MIRPIVAVGVHRADVICDGCGRVETVSCDYIKHRRTGSSPNVGQINQKMVGKGWAMVRNVLRCPACEAKRRAHDAAPKWLADAQTLINEEDGMVAKVVDTPKLRDPSPEQRGDIIEMLVACYDRKAKRYRGEDTDKTVADAVGAGCLAGWVAQIREENFGPAGGNEEIDAIRAQILSLRTECERAQKELLHDFCGKLADLEWRINKVIASVGPRAAR